MRFQRPRNPLPSPLSQCVTRGSQLRTEMCLSNAYSQHLIGSKLVCKASMRVVGVKYPGPAAG